MSFSELVHSFSRKDLPESEVEFSGSIPADALPPYRAKALSSIAKNVEIPGFRKGHVPEEMALKKVGEVAVLEEAAELVVRDLYPTLVTELHLDVVGRPDVRILKLVPGNPLELSIRVALYPDVKLPGDWKQIAAGVPEETPEAVTNEKVSEALESLRKSRTKEGEEPPALDDAFAKSVGAFEGLTDLTEKLKKSLEEEAMRVAKDKRRGKILEKLLEGTSVAIPPVFVESELEKILSQMKDDVARFGMTFEDYLKRTNKTEMGVRDEFRDQAKKRAKLQLTLNTIAKEEKVEANETAAEEEMKHALAHFPDAKPELLRIHIETVLRNEKVIRLVEGSEN